MTDLPSAEMIKYASNAFLATKVSFINEIANLCERVGADVQVVAKAMGLDHRIGSKFLHAGPGYGGSWFSQDNPARIPTRPPPGGLIENPHATPPPPRQPPAGPVGEGIPAHARSIA